MRRLLIGVLAIVVLLAGVLAFASNLNLNSAKVTVFSNTLASPELSLAPSPSDTVQAGTPVTVAATLDEATDAAGGTVTYQLYSDETCGTLHPTLHLTPDTETVTNGTVPVSDEVTITLSGSYSWRATYSGDGNNQPATSDCEVLTVTAADPAKLYFSGQPSSTSQAGSAFAEQPKVEIRDTYDNVVTESDDDVHLAITEGTGEPAAVLSCLPDSDDDNNEAADEGVATFEGCKVDKVDGELPDYTLTATSGTLPSTISNSFTITPGPAAKLAFGQQPTDAAAGASINPAVTVRVEDNFGNVVDTDTRQVAIAIDTNPSSGTLSGTASVNAVAGVATLSDLSVDKAGTGYTLVASSTPSLTGATSDAFAINAAAASKVAFSQQPSDTTTAGNDFAEQPEVQVQDSFGNVVTDSTAAVHLVLTAETAPLGAELSCAQASNTMSAVAGVAAFSECNVNKVAVAYTFTATSDGLTSATSDTFAITAGLASKFVVTGTADTQAAGALNSLTITAQDEFGNTATGYDGDKTLTFAGAGNPTSDPATAPKVTPVTGAAVAFGEATTIHFDHGVATASGGANGVMTLYKAEVAHIEATDTANGIETAEVDRLDVTVGAAGFTKLDLKLASPQPNGSVFSGSENTLTALDDYGNPILNFNAATTNVTITANSPLAGTVSGLGSGGTNVLDQGANFQQGVADLNSLGMTYTGSLGTGTFTATAGTVTDDSEPVTIEGGVAVHFVITGSATQTAGQAQSLTITAKDVVGTTDVNYDGPKSLIFSGAASAGSNHPTVTNSSGAAIAFGQETTIVFTDGVATVATGANGSMTLYAAETASIAATAGSVTTEASGELEVEVSGAAAAALLFDQQPSETASHMTISPAVTVQVLDQYGNLSPDLVAIEVALEGGTDGAILSGTTTANTSDGIATFSDLSVDLAGTGYSLQATSGSLTADTSSSFDITGAQP
jgi:hypothetical protein